MLNWIYILIVSVFILSYLFDTIISTINSRWFNNKPHKLVQDIYEEDEYLNQQKYKLENFRFSRISGLFSFSITAIILIYGLFGTLDVFISKYISSEILQSLVFFGVIGLLSTISSLPFSYYHTFNIEEKFGFNKSTKKTFFLDLIKSLLLGALLGGGILTLLLVVYQYLENNFWWIAWLIVSLFSVGLNFFYSSVIVPLFNKQEALEEGELKSAINSFADKAGFKINNIYVIDGSKRSSKANAYFAGFGSKKRIVLYDTLIKQLNTEEIVAVLAHEIGHYKHKHTIVNMLMGIVQTGIIFYILSLLLKSEELSIALGGNESKFHLSIIAFAILFSPISEFIGIFMNNISRKFEYQADNFAAGYGFGVHLVNALKKLSKNSYTNLTPHPLYVFMNYSHPQLIKRIENLLK